MDILLERILSLIPKKENGDFRHGAKKEFATSIGFKSGEIVSDWIAGRSKSYEGYVYQISALYNVSIEWLKGKTDDPTLSRQKEKPIPVTENELNESEKSMLKLFRLIPDKDQGMVVQMIEAALKSRGLL